MAIRAARAGGRVLRRKFGRIGRVWSKGGRDLVTEADREAERAILAVLQRAFPAHCFRAEESGLVGAPTSAEYQWLIDPLDGTTNYHHGYPAFAVSLACARKGQLFLGVVYDPIAGELFCAEKGRGAYLNGRSIHTSGVLDLGQALLATGFPYDIKSDNRYNFDHFLNFECRVQAIRRIGPAALNLAYVACGRFDGYWESKLYPWDMAGGAVLVAEAGGLVSDFRGRPFDPDGGRIVAGNPAIHAHVLSVLALGQSGLGD